MIKPLARADFGPFFDLFGEVESGAHYDSCAHRDWLTRHLDYFYRRELHFFGQWQDQTPTGFLSLEYHPRANGRVHAVEIVHLGILQAFRRRGLASELLAFAGQFAAAIPAHCLYISTYAGDAIAVACYVKNGFIPVATLPDMHGPNDEGQIFLRKLLKIPPGKN